LSKYAISSNANKKKRRKRMRYPNRFKVKERTDTMCPSTILDVFRKRSGHYVAVYHSAGDIDVDTVLSLNKPCFEIRKVGRNWYVSGHGFCGERYKTLEDAVISIAKSLEWERVSYGVLDLNSLNEISNVYFYIEKTRKGMKN